MKLSEAIRLGSMMKPQAFRAFYINGGSCALGAACDAIGINALIMSEWPIAWRTFLDDFRLCPECGHETKPGQLHTISHLNDSHRWTRERIADYVETVELAKVMPVETEVLA